MYDTMTWYVIDIIVTLFIYREGIRTGTLDEVERKYVHPDLQDSLVSSDGLSLGQ